MTTLDKINILKEWAKCSGCFVEIEGTGHIGKGIIKTVFNTSAITIEEVPFPINHPEPIKLNLADLELISKVLSEKGTDQ